MNKTERFGLLPALLAGAIAWGAVPPRCATIEFLTARQLPLVVEDSLLVVEQQPGGAYSAFPYLSAEPYQRGNPIPNFERRLRGCLPAEPHQSEGLQLRTRPAGSPASSVLLIPDAGDATPVALWNLFYGDSIRLFRANSDLTVRASELYPAGQIRVASLTADYTGDGKPDIAVLLAAYTYHTSEPAGIKVLPGKGDGTFGAAIFTPLPKPDPQAFAQADFNGDGRIDLAIGFNDSTVLILLGNPGGSFTPATTFHTGGILTNIGAADLDSDGNADLQVLTAYPDTLTLYRGSGTSFGQPKVFPMPSTPAYVAATDLNADHRLDLALSFRADSSVGILLANRDGGFDPLTSYVAGNQPATLFPADIDQDGNVDLVLGEGLPTAFAPTEQTGNVAVLFGRGDGTFSAAQVRRTPHKYSSYVMADVNGDGRQDFIAIDPYTSPPTITLMLRAGTGALLAAQTLSVLPSGSGARFSSVAAADFNQDGNLDLTLGESSPGAVWISYGNGDGTFQTASRMELSAGVAALATADLNQDGRADLAAAVKGPGYGDPSSVVLLLSRKTGGFAPPAVIATARSVSRLALVDLDGDHAPDLIIGDAGAFDEPQNPARLLILKAQGGGRFLDPVSYPLGTAGLDFAIADLNRDGRPDLVATTQGDNYDDRLVTLLNQGGANFTTFAPIPTDFGPGRAAIADLNGDHIPDLVIPHCCGDTDLTYLAGNGDGTFQPEVHFAGGQDPTAVIPTDLDGDGKPDLAVLGGAATGTGGTLATLINVSPSPGDFRNVSAASYLPIPLSPDSVGAALGTDLATTFFQAPDSTSPQFSLQGTSLAITAGDGNQYAAPLFLVAPSLVLYLVPAAVPAGPAAVTITRGDGRTLSAPLEIAPVAPALLAANSSGLASGSLLSVSPDGGETWSDIATTTPGGAIVPVPIDLDSISGRLYLVVNGTGFRNRAALSDVHVNLGGRSLAPAFAGPIENIPGMDQLRVELKPDLRDMHGDIPLSITLAGYTSNTVTIRLR
ncbi:MAG: VCBS repeat-containing protein [Bryobacterales bacterium]|nr:VCBS repeat-containing protein [Bryobacterales bacterium]